jgi:hypothetical protein
MFIATAIGEVFTWELTPLQASDAESHHTTSSQTPLNSLWNKV